MGSILITGVDGFTGRHVARALVQAGHEVHGLTRATALVDGLASITACDIRDEAALRHVISATAPSRVLHLAAVAFAAHTSADAFYKINILGSRALLEACLTSGGERIRQVILASSASVYGRAEGKVDEHRAAAPANDYAVSKLAMEYMARLYVGRLPVTITRPFNYTGVGQSTDFLIAKIVDHVRRRAPVIQLGNLGVVRDFSDVRSVADVYLRLLDRSPYCSDVEIFNICSGVGHSLQQVLSLACETAGHTMEVQVNPALVRASDVSILIGNKDRLDHAIGPLKRPTLAETIRWMVEAT
jgi:nucleoside-diphosphate-sugar epimerase